MDHPTHRPTDQPTWMRSDRFLARTVARPVSRFLEIEAASGVLLILAVVIAIAWASSPWDGSYHALWSTELRIQLGDRSWGTDLRHCVDDGAMVLFFFVIGLEVKREVVEGQLADRRAVLLPLVGAIGGMVVPALIYVAVNAGGDGAPGWAMPMATDVAFALAVLAVLGSRVPGELKMLLLALAIVDDIGAVIVIALFYGDGVALGWLAVAAAGLAAIAALKQARVWWTPIYLALGVGVWAATVQSGVHATLAGVALGLLAPARPLLRGDEVRVLGRELHEAEHLSEADLQSARFTLRESTSVADTIQHWLHPWTAYIVVPLFALANAGLALSADGVRDAATSRITLGVVLGLVVGKAVGITSAIALARRARIVELPTGLDLRHIAGMAAIAGIGFTVSLFVGSLAFTDDELLDQARMGILAGSLLAGGLGWVVLRTAPDRRD